jgi:hypothetical protein
MYSLKLHNQTCVALTKIPAIKNLPLQQHQKKQNVFIVTDSAPFVTVVDDVCCE